MSRFYARYVPPAAPETQSKDNGLADLKRSSPVRSPHTVKRRKIVNEKDGDEITVEYSSTQAAPHASQGRKSYVTKKDVNSSQMKSPSERTITGQQHASESVLGEDAAVSKHTKVLSKFQRAGRREKQMPDSSSDAEKHAKPGKEHIHPDRQNQVHDLRPIPQPDVRDVVAPTPSFATGPEWLRAPLRVDDTVGRNLQDMGLSKRLQRNLVAQNIQTALPVQSAVLPLIMNRELEKRNDLCVAAATGSGKTLAYVLPILNALEGRLSPRLRAVVVVPTRALVKQVAKAFELYSDGMDILVGTAEGSRSLAEEQKQLIEERLIYDPDEYTRRQEAPIDWGRFNPVKLIEDAQQENKFTHTGFVKGYFSKIDILVCTPGRLVEHLQTSEGFNLDQVHWFVADEADRLLNESYHEWLETVLPALRSQRASNRRNELLRHMYFDVPERRVTKILLSATMTRDVSQLISLELKDPRLVVVESRNTNAVAQEEAFAANEDAEYRMPPGLMEFAITFKDTENKPLYLLELLNKHIFGESAKHVSHIDQPAPKSTLQEEEDGTSSSGSDAESDDSHSSASSSDTSTSSASSVDTSDSSLNDASDAETSPKGREGYQNTSASKPQKLGPRVLVFTKSTESAHRLSRLLALLFPSLSSKISTFTRSTTSTTSSNKAITKSRAKILQAFTLGKTSVLISTDLAARGLDIPNLEHVINYDVPASALTYVHRVGRTARAGMSGHAWTLVEHRQGKWFWEVIGGKGEGGKVIGRGGRTIQKVTVAFEREAWSEKYEAALKQLGEDVRAR